MILEHYRSAPLTDKLVSKRQLKSTGLYTKPAGLWVSAKGEYDWPWWCEAESFRLERLKSRHIVHLNDHAKILFINNQAEFDEFHARWFLDDPETTVEIGGTLYSRSFNPHRGIRWYDLAKKYHGIVIAPYFWDRRLADPWSSWYYGWDCASGCIWNAKAIKSVEYVGEYVPVTEEEEEVAA